MLLPTIKESRDSPRWIMPSPPEDGQGVLKAAKPHFQKSILEITRADVVTLLDGYGDRPGMKKLVHSVLRKPFNWAVGLETGMWQLRFERAKNNQLHRIPLNALAIAELRRFGGCTTCAGQGQAISGRWMFPWKSPKRSSIISAARPPASPGSITSMNMRRKSALLAAIPVRPGPVPAGDAGPGASPIRQLHQKLGSKLK